jgi:hypothetical protein
MARNKNYSRKILENNMDKDAVIKFINKEIPKDFIIAFHNIINNLDGLGWEEIEKFKIQQSMIWIKSLLEQTKVNNVEAELNWWKEQLEIIEPPFEDKEEVDLLKGEWIYDHGKLTEADVKTHEETIQAAIFNNHRKKLVSIAEKLIKQIESKKPEELEEELEEKLEELKEYKDKIKNLLDDIGDDIGEKEITNIDNLYSAIKDINPQLVSNPKLTEGMQVLTHGDVRKYGCKSLGFIIIRGPFFEVWELNQDTANEIVDAAEKIMEEKREDRSREDEQTIGIHSYKTNKGSEYTIEQLRDKKLNVTPTISQGKSNHFIPQASTPEGLSTTQRHQLRYTSENFSFKNWFLESNVINPFQAVRPKWVKPDLYEEREEMERQAGDLNLDVKTVQIAFIRAKLITLDDATWNKMKNTHSTDPNISIEKIKTWKKDGKTVDAIIRGLEEGETIPAPMVLIHDGIPYCVAGNTRLSISKVLGVRPKVLLATIF